MSCSAFVLTVAVVAGASSALAGCSRSGAGVTMKPTVGEHDHLLSTWSCKPGSNQVKLRAWKRSSSFCVWSIS